MDNLSITRGYQALAHGAAILDLSARGRIRVTGEDRARLLHAMTTNHVQQLKPGDGLYAFFLNAQGRVQADVYILCFEDHLLLDTEPETRIVIYEHLDRYIIADDVTLDDVTGATFCLGLEGPGAFEMAQAAGVPVPLSSCEHLDWSGFTVAAISATGSPSLRIYGPMERKSEAVRMLEAMGAKGATGEEAERVRIEHFRPRFGQDFTESTLPQETGQMHALHFQKGCYLGQEIVERIRSRGHVNKRLMGFRMEPATEHRSDPRSGVKVFSGGKDAGEVTSCATGSGGAVSGLAYVRVPFDKPGGTVEIEGNCAGLFDPSRA